jgi:histidinol phosphatase-like PHP family hydrolase
MELKIGSSDSIVNGIKVNTGVEATIINGTIYLPAKFVFESFDFEVSEDNKRLKATNK